MCFLCSFRWVEGFHGFAKLIGIMKAWENLSAYWQYFNNGIYLDFSSMCHIVPPHNHTCSGSKLCSLAKIVVWTWTFVLNCSAKLAHGILSGKYAVPSKKVWRLWWFSIFYMIIVVSAACCKNVIVMCLSYLLKLDFPAWQNCCTWNKCVLVWLMFSSLCYYISCRNLVTC